MRKILCFFGFHKYKNEPVYELLPTVEWNMYEKVQTGTAVVCKYCRKEIARW